MLCASPAKHRATLGADGSYDALLRASGRPKKAAIMAMGQPPGSATDRKKASDLGPQPGECRAQRSPTALSAGLPVHSDRRSAARRSPIWDPQWGRCGLLTT
jgi:hypothetical protein